MLAAWEQRALSPLQSSLVNLRAPDQTAAAALPDPRRTSPPTEPSPTCLLLLLPLPAHHRLPGHPRTLTAASGRPPPLEPPGPASPSPAPPPPHPPPLPGSAPPRLRPRPCPRARPPRSAGSRLPRRRGGGAIRCGSTARHGSARLGERLTQSQGRGAAGSAAAAEDRHVPVHVPVPRGGLRRSAAPSSGSRRGRARTRSCGQPGGKVAARRKGPEPSRAQPSREGPAQRAAALRPPDGAGPAPQAALTGTPASPRSRHRGRGDAAGHRCGKNQHAKWKENRNCSFSKKILAFSPFHMFSFYFVMGGARFSESLRQNLGIIG